MPRVFKKEGRFYCDEDTDEAVLMREIIEADEQQKEAKDVKKRKRLLLEKIAFENGEPEPIFLESPDFIAHWEFIHRNIVRDEWDMLQECFPEAYEALKGDERRSKPFLVVTRKKK